MIKRSKIKIRNVNMIFIPVTKLTTIDELLKKVDQGEVCVITKEGEPILELLPLKTKKKPRWKRKIKRIKLKGEKTTTEIIREERDLS